MIDSITVNNISVSYDGNEVVKDVSFSFETWKFDWRAWTERRRKINITESDAWTDSPRTTVMSISERIRLMKCVSKLPMFHNVRISTGISQLS